MPEPTNPNNDVQLMDQDSAYALVHQQVYTPVFFSKLASDYGIRPQNREEAETMLVMAERMRQAHEQEATKVAQAGNPLLKAAFDHLNNALEADGYEVNDERNEALVEKAAGEVAGNPQIAHAILSMQAIAAHNAAQHAS